MNDEDGCKQGVRVQGTFMGQPCDFTVVEYEVPEPEPEAVTAPDEAAAPEETTPADPAPEVKETSDEAPNPAGNAEQL